MEKVAVIAIRHWKALLGFNILVFSTAIGVLVTTPRVWTATAQLLLPASSGGNLDANLGPLGSYSSSDPSFSTLVNPLKIQQAILRSDVLLSEVWEADPERSHPTKPRGYSGFFEVSPREQTTVMELAVQGSSPEIAQKRADAWLAAYQKRLNELRQQNNQAREGFSEKQLGQARKRLTEAQTTLAQFQRSTGLVNSSKQTEGLVGTISALTTAQAQSEAQAQASQNQVRALSSRLQLAPQEAIRALELDQNEDYQLLRKELTTAETNLASLRGRFGDRNPTVQKWTAIRDNLQVQLDQYVAQTVGRAGSNLPLTSGAEGQSTLIQQLILAESEASGQRRQAEQLQTQINQLRSSLRSLPEDQIQLIELQRQLDVAEGVYKGLVAQMQQSNIDAFSAYPNIQVLDPPTVDPKPSSPKKSIMAINAMMAAIVGSIALVLLLEARNPLLRPKDLQSIKFPLVVRIPRLKYIGMESDLGTEAEVKFQRLASAISLQPLKSNRLLITSAMVGEGKTTVTLRLATALTDLGFRVLMVDGDFRRADLSHRLRYAFSRDESRVVPIQPNLDFLPTQPKQGKIVDSVARGRFEQYLANAESTINYDYVLIDSAPISLTSETALMATVISNILFVVRPGVSARNAVNDGLEQLMQHNAKVVGLIINGVESQPYGYPERSVTPLDQTPA